MRNKTRKTLPRITNKEKSAPAYIKKVEMENTQLKASLETTQNQASVLQQKCSELEKDNSVLNEKLNSSGFGATIKDLCILIGGIGISYLIEKDYVTASILLVSTFALMLFYWIVTNFKKQKQN